MEYLYYNLLKEKGIADPEKLFEHIKKLIQAQLIDLCHEVDRSIEENSLLHTGPAKESIFNFTASPHSIGLEGPCRHLGCRLTRVDDFIRYSLLYADAVILPNVFPNYLDPPNLTAAQLDFIRMNVLGDMLVLLRLKDLFDADIASFVPNSIELCGTHGALFEDKWDEVEEGLTTAADGLVRDIASSCRVILLATKEGVRFSVLLPDVYFEGDMEVIVPVPPSEGLVQSKSYQHSLSSGEPVELSKKEIEDLGVIETALLDIIPWARMYLFSSMFMPSKFLTSRPADDLILESALSNEDLRLSSRNIKENILLRMPIIEGVPCSALIKVRRSDYDAFANFRNKIMQVQKEYINHKGILTRDDTIQIYEDLVYPGVEQVENKLGSLRRELRSTAMRRIAIVATFATLGLSLGLLPPGASTALKQAAACEVVKSAVNIWKSIAVPEEIRQDPFYFLWKVQRKPIHA